MSDAISRNDEVFLKQFTCYEELEQFCYKLEEYKLGIFPRIFPCNWNLLFEGPCFIFSNLVSPQEQFNNSLVSGLSSNCPLKQKRVLPK